MEMLALLGSWECCLGRSGWAKWSQSMPRCPFPCCCLRLTDVRDLVTLQQLRSRL